jgi:Transposase DDE domain
VVEIVASVRATLTSPETVRRYRLQPSAWTRQRKLPFLTVVTVILSGPKRVLQHALNRVFQALGRVRAVPTASASSQARQKLHPALFQPLNEVVIEGFYRLYGADGEVRRWQGRRVVGSEGSVFNVPDTAETRQCYSVQTNQYAGGERVQALGSVGSDLLNHVALSAGLGKKQAEKQFLFTRHLSVTDVGDVIVLDRGYADYRVMATLHAHQRDFVLRLPRQSFRAVEPFWTSPEREQLVTLTLPRSQRRFVAAQDLATSLQVRLIKVDLPTGQQEVLATSLLDVTAYSHATLQHLYRLRWGVETYYDRLKNIFEIERFSGRSVLSSEQDFYGVIFLATFESVVSKEAEAELAQASATHARKYEARINRTVSYLALVDYTVALLLDPHATLEETLATLQHLFKTNPTPSRPGRQVPRKVRSPAHQVWFLRYANRLIA